MINRKKKWELNKKREKLKEVLKCTKLTEVQFGPLVPSAEALVVQWRLPPENLLLVKTFDEDDSFLPHHVPLEEKIKITETGEFMLKFCTCLYVQSSWSKRKSQGNRVCLFVLHR